MEKYHYQIKEEGKGWAYSEARTLEFPTRQKASEFARNLANLFKAEVRMTNGYLPEGSNVNMISGSFFSPKSKITVNLNVTVNSERV